jgi:predicted extracellular nuclease
MKKLLLLLVLGFFANVSFSQCSELFFSEYVEGSSSSKAIEIYNPTSVPVSLNGYKVQLYTNGSTAAGSTLNLTGTLNAGDVYVIANSSSNDSIKAKADTLSNGVTNFNGNDAVALLKGSDTLDVIGKIGDNPGNNAGWVVDTADTRDNTLVRQAAIQGGTKDWTVGSLQWVVLPRDTIQLGAHLMNSCAPISDTLVRFSTSSDIVSESAGTVNLSLQLNAVSAVTSFSVDVVLDGGTGSAADINNYTTQTVTINAGSVSNSLALTVTDDVLQEGAETLIFKLRNPSSPLLVGADSIFTLTIAANDAPPATVTISQITGLNANQQPDSLGKVVIVSGTVYGVNMRTDSLQFTIQDATDGVEVVSYNSTFGYALNEGDSVSLIGVVAFSNGMTQVEITDTVYKVGTGALLSPVVVQDLDETTESKLVRLNNVTLVTPSQWGTGASGYTCDITDGVGTWTLRIDAQTNLYGTPAPVGNFNVIGLGGQFDNSSPYNSGYQLLPRYTQDIILISGIERTSSFVRNVYPNPNSGSFYVSLQTTETANLKLFDITGQIVYNMTAESQLVNVNTSQLANGVYFLEVSVNGIVSREKVVIE